MAYGPGRPFFSGTIANIESWLRPLADWVESRIGILNATSSQTIRNDIYYVRVDTTSGDVTITLPYATGHAGKQITVEKISSDGNTLTLGRLGSDTINGAATQTLTAQYGFWTVIANGDTAWEIISTNTNVTAPGATTQVIFNDAGALAGDAGFTFDKTNNVIAVSGTGHVFGSASPDADFSWYLTGAFTGVTNSQGMVLTPALTIPVGGGGYGFNQAASFTTAASGTHGIITGAIFQKPTITNLGAAVTNAASVYILNAPTGGTNNYALFVDAGAVRLDETLLVTGNLTNSTLTAGRVVFAGTAGLLDDDAGFTFNDSTKSITLGGDVAGAVTLGVSNSNTAADSTAHMSFVETSSSGGGFVFRAWSAATSTIGNLAEMSSTAIGTGIGTMGMAIYTQNSRTLGFGTVSQLTDLVIDTSHNTTINGTLKLGGSSSGFVGLKGAAAAGSAIYTLPTADGTKSYGLTTDGSATLSWQDVGGRNVVMYGADPTGSADSLSAIQAAIDACGTSGMVYFPPGTYKITNAIRMGSNIKLYGAGYASQISYAGTGGITVDWVNGGGSGTEYFMLLNENGHNRAGTVDTNIEIAHLRFTYTSGTVPHCVFFMNTTNCNVHHCYADGGTSDLCCFLKSSYYKVTNNYATGCTNCCYDNWDGPSYGVIANNVAVPASGGSGIFVNGVATDTTTPVNNDGHHIVVANNVIRASHADCIQGIYLAGLNATSTVKHCTVVGNTVTTASSDTLKFDVGIDVRQGGFNTVSGNVVSGAMDSSSIEIQCNHNSITGNIIEGASVAIEFASADYNSITGNVIEGATTGLSLPAGSDYNQVSGNIFQGNTTDISDAGTGNQNTTNSSANTLNIVQ